MATFYSIKDWKVEYDPEDNEKKTRTIGLELEAQILPKTKIPVEYSIINDEIASKHSEEFGGRWTGSEEHRDWLTKKLQEKGVGIMSWGFDGGGKEFVTMPDSITMFEKGGSERFKKTVEMLNSSTKPDNQSGTHIHVSKLDTDVKSTWDNLYWFCMVFGPQLQKIFGRRSGWAPVPLPSNFFTKETNRQIKLFEAPQEQPHRERTISDKHVMVNDKGNRYEFRGPKASNDLEELLAWVELCHNIVEICAQGYIKEVRFGEALKGKHIRAYVNRINKENKLRTITPEDRASKISDIGYVIVNTRTSNFEKEEEE